MSEKYVLSEADLQVLRDVVDRERKRSATYPLRSRYDETLPRGRDVYIARVGEGGIPALGLSPGTGSGSDIYDAPGVTVCDVYQLTNSVDPPYFNLVYEDETVYNLSDATIEEHQWIVIIRDKFGNWLALAPNDTDTDEEPKIYVARTPSAGISALGLSPGTASASDIYDDPGTGYVDVYEIIEPGEPSFRLVYIDQLVYNLSAQAIAGDIWIIIVKDEFDDWLCVAPSDDVYVKVSSTDPTAGYLYDKLDAGTAITLTKIAGEKVRIAATAASKSSNQATVTAVAVTNAWANSGASLSLPAAGTYKVTAVVEASLACNTAGDNIQTRLWNSTDSSIIGSELTTAFLQQTTGGCVTALVRGSATHIMLVTVAGPKTITLQSKYTITAIPVIADLTSVWLHYVEI